MHVYDPPSAPSITSGGHTFQVRQVDSAGNTSATATRTWTGRRRQHRNDGVDNDGDGRTDHPDDLGCASPTDDSEGPTYVENYRFVVGSVTVVLPCVRLVTTPETANPCAQAGGTFAEPIATSQCATPN